MLQPLMNDLVDHHDLGNANLLSSNLACLSILFSFFGTEGFDITSVDDSVSKISAAYNAFITMPNGWYTARSMFTYRHILPATYLDTFYLIFLDCELSLGGRLNRMVVGLGSETSRLWLSSRSDIRSHGRSNSHSRGHAIFFRGRPH